MEDKEKKKLIVKVGTEISKALVLSQNFVRFTNVIGPETLGNNQEQATKITHELQKSNKAMLKACETFAKLLEENKLSIIQRKKIIVPGQGGV